MSTRMMQQYHDAKAQHPGMIVLFRNADFAVWPGKGNTFGVAWVDISSGVSAAADVPAGRLADEFARLNAAEVLFAESAVAAVTGAAGVTMPRTRSARPDWTFDPVTA